MSIQPIAWFEDFQIGSPAGMDVMCRRLLTITYIMTRKPLLTPQEAYDVAAAIEGESEQVYMLAELIDLIESGIEAL